MRGETFVELIEVLRRDFLSVSSNGSCGVKRGKGEKDGREGKSFQYPLTDRAG